MSEGLDLDVYKDIPGYKGILKAVLKSQIQLMVHQLAHHTGEESILLSASVSDGTFSHLGSDFGKDFIRSGHDDFKAKFLGFCLEKYHKRKREDRPSTAKRFAVSSNKQRTKGHIGEAVSKIIGRGSPGFRPSTTPPKQMTFSSPENAHHPHPPTFDTHKRRERTLEPPRKIPRGNNVQSSLPARSTEPVEQNNTAENLVKVKVEADADKSRVDAEMNNKQGRESVTLAEVNRQGREPVTLAEVNRQGREPVTLAEVNRQGREPVTLTEVNNIQGSEAGSGEQRNTGAEQTQLTTKSDDYTPMTESSYDYVLDQGRETEASPLPWQPNGALSGERQSSSKRKQSVPVRHNPGLLNVDESEFTEDDLSISMVTEEGQNIRDRGQIIGSGNEARDSPIMYVYNNETKMATKWPEESSSGATDLTFGDLSGGRNASPGLAAYSDADSKNMVAMGDSDSADAKNYYMKTPQIDGLLVSRGEGRYEKLIKCEICGKICRTSNMARHKKRYCLGGRKGSGSPGLMNTMVPRGELSLGGGAVGYSQEFSPLDPYAASLEAGMELDVDDIGSSGSS